MISDEVTRDGLAAIAVGAVMLLEDAAEGLTTAADDLGDRHIATTLAALGADLSALAAAAGVFARHRRGGV